MPTTSSIWLLGRDAQLLLHLDLDRQPVGVPPGLAGHGVAAHGPVAAEQVLVDPGPHMVEAGAPVGRRRSLVEDPGLGAGPQLDGALEDAVLTPAGQLVGLDDGEIGFGGDRAEQRVRPLGGRVGSGSAGIGWGRVGRTGRPCPDLMRGNPHGRTRRSREIPTLVQVWIRYYGRRRATIALCPNSPRSKP